MKENPNIDELLNSFIDGELTQRQFTEVQRLAAHDEQIAQRLCELQECKVLVSSLPSVEAPSWMADEIKTTFERKALLGQALEHCEERRGARHLLFRKVVSAAAMIGLAAVLLVVIYTILVPESVPDKPVAVGSSKQPTREIEFERTVPRVVKEIEAEVPRPTIAVATEKTIAESGLPVVVMEKSVGFTGRLELKTGGSPAVAAFISRVIEDNGLFEKEVPAYQSDKRRYILGGNQKAMSLLLADLQNVWSRLDSTRLYVETDRDGDEVVIDAVTAEQIAEIINQDGIENRMKVAKDFAVLNSMDELLPGKEVFAAIKTNKSNLFNIPKPVLTSNEKALKKPAEKIENSQKVYLTIVIVDGE
ncbi:MAG: anti-sigma factor family protein [Planctomycetota bacterium]|jgi:hypothetical protein